MNKLIFGGVSGALMLLLLAMFWPLTSVPVGHVGVVSVFGQIKETPLEPGLSLINPMAKVDDVNVQQQTSEATLEAGTKDLQNVNAKVIVNYHPEQKLVPKLMSEVGPTFPAKLIVPAVQDRLKSVTSKFNAEELVTKRDDVRRLVKQQIIEMVRERSNGMIAVDDVILANLDFAKSFTKAIEDKQVAEQLAFKAQRDLERIKIEAEQKIAVAKAEAESLRAQKEQITPMLIELRRIESNNEAIKKWNGVLPAQMLGSAVPFINVGK